MSNARRGPAVRVSCRAFFVSLATPSIENAGFRRPFLSQTAGRKAAVKERDDFPRSPSPARGGAFEREGDIRYGTFEEKRSRASGYRVHQLMKKEFQSIHRLPTEIRIPVSARFPCYSLFSRRMPSMSGCHPNTSVTMQLSMRRSPGELSLRVDL